MLAKCLNTCTTKEFYSMFLCSYVVVDQFACFGLPLTFREGRVWTLPETYVFKVQQSHTTHGRLSVLCLIHAGIPRKKRKS